MQFSKRRAVSRHGKDTARQEALQPAAASIQTPASQREANRLTAARRVISDADVRAGIFANPT